ncbi:hypothetical protein Nepgr_029117 [Nepenthes gracilis]|uniref:Uncharacterized protein n=1 Tax=Nepenthes gracilis TaxID=150966 RepID=A0AAD3TE56_NEPGR|nr:hypothetical protein Nepgr_029117 [Nepenthes gracilis]
MLGTLSTIFGCFQPSRVSSSVADHDHHDDGGRCSNMKPELLDEEMKKPSRVSSSVADHDHHDDGGRCSNMKPELLDEEMKKVKSKVKGSSAPIPMSYFPIGSRLSRL